MYPTIRFEQPLEDVVVAINQNTPTNITAGLTGNRQALSITNCDATQNAYIAYTESGAAAPTLSTASFVDILVPGAKVPLQAGKRTWAWALNNGVGPTNVRVVTYQ